MFALVKPQDITGNSVEKVSVIIPVSEYERIIEELEDMHDVRLFDEVKALRNHQCLLII